MNKHEDWKDGWEDRKIGGGCSNKTGWNSLLSRMGAKAMENYGTKRPINDGKITSI